MLHSLAGSEEKSQVKRDFLCSRERRYGIINDLVDAIILSMISQRSKPIESFVKLRIVVSMFQKLLFASVRSCTKW